MKSTEQNKSAKLSYGNILLAVILITPSYSRSGNGAIKIIRGPPKLKAPIGTSTYRHHDLNIKRGKGDIKKIETPKLKGPISTSMKVPVSFQEN